MSNLGVSESKSVPGNEGREERQDGRAHQADPVHEFDSVDLCQPAADQLGGHVAVGEGGQQLAPRELIPLEAAVCMQVGTEVRTYE